MISSLTTRVTGAPIQHWMKEQVLDALDILDPKHNSDLAISTYGKLNVYEDGTSEFLWKGLRAILFINKGIDPSGNLILEAIHKYEGIDRRVNFGE